MPSFLKRCLSGVRYTALAVGVFFATLSVISVARGEDAAPAATSTNEPAGIDPRAVGYIIAGLLAGGSGYAWGKSRSVNIEPQPFKVEMAKTFATREELMELASRHEKFEEEMRGWVRESETRTHRRMDEIASKLDMIVGRLRGTGHNV